MGIDLHNGRGRSFSCSGGMWHVYRKVAEEFGWTPAGTIPPPDHVGTWSGDYELDECQRVSGIDAAGLASALERAIGSPALEATFFRILSQCGVVPENENVREYLFLYEPERLADLARFCRGGEFEIR